jgi:hypothetical protein
MRTRSAGASKLDSISNFPAFSAPYNLLGSFTDQGKQKFENASRVQAL